ncbi:lysophospholipid acyltransferase family protein [Kangiella sp. TOML190]|uniref:lysophospholipid acyltransferase family protein n=1 Tax=Kangiella sp. TOML190 TaxID=2931351 RepID=UPI002042140E|nr:lysophospholipid acyltransferase family protein [Kangiella sp. TOML190]
MNMVNLELGLGAIIGLCFGLALLIVLLLLNRLGKKYNQVDWGGTFFNRIDGIFRYYCLNFHNLKFKGLDSTANRFHLPKTGGALVISNHFSGIDPFLLIAACDRPIRFMIAKEEYQRWYLKWLFKGAGCIPVDRTGRADIAFRQAKRALDKGEIIALFPHGKIHLDHEQPYRVKPGIRKLAQLSKVPIFVARLTGVRGQGSVFTPLFLRSNCVVTQHPNLDHEYFEQTDSLLKLGELLLGHRESL